jgi:hypothetical protein
LPLEAIHHPRTEETRGGAQEKEDRERCDRLAVLDAERPCYVWRRSREFQPTRTPPSRPAFATAARGSPRSVAYGSTTSAEIVEREAVFDGHAFAYLDHNHVTLSYRG